MMNGDALDTLKAAGAVQSGHFLLSSGRHSDQYVEKFHLLRNPAVTSRLVAELVPRLDSIFIDLVAGPTTGGILLAFELGRQLRKPTAYAERRSDGSTSREFRRGTVIAPGTRVLVIDDILTTGGSVRETLAALDAHAADVVGVAVLVDRSGGAVSFGDLPLYPIASLEITTWPASECPLCAGGLPLVKPGTTAVS